MRLIAVLFMAFALFFSACKYEYPLTERHAISIDPALTGLWEYVRDRADGEGPRQLMMILKFSDSEYVIHYPAGRDGLYYRGYPVEIGKVPCVQLEVIGTKDGPLPMEEKRRFHVVSYSLAGDYLRVKALNTDVVDDKLKSGKEMRKAFLKNRENNDLFINPDIFRRVGK